LCGSKPGFTLPSAESVRIINPASDKKHDRHGHFDNDENALRAMACAARTASAFLQGFVSIGPQGLERGNQSKDDAGQNGDTESVKEHVAVESNLLRTGHIGGQSREENAHAQLRQKEANATSRDAKQDAFGKQLANHPSGTGSKSSANRKFATAGAGGTSEKEIGDVGAGIKSTKLTAPSSTSKIPFTLPTTSALSGIRETPVPLSASGYAAARFFRNAIHVRAGLLDGYVGLQATDGVHAHADAPIAESRIGPLTDGNVEVGGTESGDTALSHSNDCVGLAVQCDAFPQNILRQTKFALPKSVAKDGYRTGARLIFFGTKSAAKQRRQAEGGKKLLRGKSCEYERARARRHLTML